MIGMRQKMMRLAGNGKLTKAPLDSLLAYVCRDTSTGQYYNGYSDQAGIDAILTAALVSGNVPSALLPSHNLFLVRSVSQVAVDVTIQEKVFSCSRYVLPYLVLLPVLLSSYMCRIPRNT